MEQNLEAVEDAKKISEAIWGNIYDSIEWVIDNFPSLLWIFIQTAFVVVMALLFIAITKKIIKFIIKRNSVSMEKGAKRVSTIATLMQSVVTYAVFAIAIIIILSLFGVGDSVTSAVAAAGIGGIALGFGAQNLVRDVVTGFFILFEDQFAVGDYIKTNEAEGIVEASAVRVTYLRSLRGDQIIIPNGTIERVINYTRGGYTAMVEIGVGYESDTRMIIQIIDAAVLEYALQNSDKIVDRPKVLGISRFEDSSIIITVICQAQPMKQWEVERGMRLAVKEAFDASGIGFPYPHRVMVSQQPPAPKPPAGAYAHGAHQSASTRVKPIWQQKGFGE